MPSYADSLKVTCDLLRPHVAPARDIRPSDRIRRHEQYEDYILSEVLPLTRELNPNPFMITHGCSLGAYHSLNIALRHPHLFGKVLRCTHRERQNRHGRVLPSRAREARTVHHKQVLVIVALTPLV